MGEPLLTHQVVRLEGSLQVRHVDADRAPHEHVLRSLHNLAIHLQEIGSLQRLEAEKVILEVTGVVNHFIYALIVVLNDLQDVIGQERRWSAALVLAVVQLLGRGKNAAIGLIMQSLDGNSVGELGVVRVHNGHVGASFGGQIRNLFCRHS